MLASLLRIILLTATLKILERGLDKGPIIQKGYNTAERIGTWKDYIVYSPVILPINGIVPPTGLPCFIVEKDNEYSWVSGQKAFQIMNELVR